MMAMKFHIAFERHRRPKGAFSAPKNSIILTYDSIQSYAHNFVSTLRIFYVEMATSEGEGICTSVVGKQPIGVFFLYLVERKKTFVQKRT